MGKTQAKQPTALTVGFGVQKSKHLGISHFCFDCVILWWKQLQFAGQNIKK